MTDENQMEPKTEAEEPQPENLPAPPKRRGRPKKIQRENVIDSQGWGSSSKVIAPEPEPNPVVLPAPEEAVKALARLADLNDAALAAHDRWQTAQKRAKDLKGEWEALVGRLQSALKAATHTAPMPLFDADQAEADLAKMEAAVIAMAEAPAQDGPATVLAFPQAGEQEPEQREVSPEPSESLLEAPSGSAELF